MNRAHSRSVMFALVLLFSYREIAEATQTREANVDAVSAQLAPVQAALPQSTTTTDSGTVRQEQSNVAAAPSPASPPLLPPPLVTDTYAAKFTCGVATDVNITHQPDVQAGRYSTVINVHNNTGMAITFRKKGILLTLQQDTPPGVAKPIETLQPNHALRVSCSDIYYLIGFFHHQGQIPPFMEGFVVFEVFYPFGTTNMPSDPLDVQAVYTYRSDIPATTGGNGVSIAVVSFPVKRNPHLLRP